MIASLLHLTLPAPPAAALTLAPTLGGNIARFTVADVDVLRPASPVTLAEGNVRDTASYPLIPYSNRIAAATLAWDGRQHALARNFGDHPNSIHGVGWQRPWTVQARTATAATLALAYAPGDGAWPFAFTAAQRFALAASDGSVTLTMTLTLASNDADAFPFGLGWHPFFVRDADTTLQFDADGVWTNDATQLPVAHTALPAERDHRAPRTPPPLDNVFTGWRGNATLHTARHAIRIEADSACRHVVVYAPEGRDFVAIEPVTQMTDAFNRAARGERDTGTRVLRAGQAFSCTMRIVVTPA